MTHMRPITNRSTTHGQTGCCSFPRRPSAPRELSLRSKVNRAGVTANELVNVDLKATIKPALQRIRDGYVTRARLLSEELLSLAEKLDASQEHVTERAEDNAVLEQRVRDASAT